MGTNRIRITPKVYVTDPTAQAGTPDNSVPLNDALANIYEASQGEDTFGENTPVTGITIGGLPKGTDISGRRVKDVLNDAFYPEYAPKWTDASASISAKNIADLVEVGTTIPTATASEFTVGGSPAVATGGSNAAHGGSATDTITCDAAEVGVIKSTAGAVTYTATRAYAAGSEVVKTNKGNATNKTAGNATTFLSDASANSNIDATTKTIKAITKTATKVITFVDAFYANASNIGTLTKLALTSASQLELNYPSAPGSARQSFSIPASYTNVKVYVWNSMSNGGEYQLYAGTLSTESETKTIADGETPKAYIKYSLNEDNRPACKIKVTFTKA